MDAEVTRIELKQTFKECPACQYGDGFHSMFKKDDGVTRWLFICPACHRVFDIGFTVQP